MKKIWMYFRSDPGSLKKVWLMSRWAFVFLFVLGINVHASVYSQIDRQVQLSMKGVNLKDVLWEIEKQTSFVFMYNAEDLDKVGKMDISIQTDRVEDILQKCLEGTNLTYSIQDAVIVLKPIGQAQQVKEVKTVGKVTDVNRSPLPGTTVIVCLEGEGRPIFGTSTDIEGRYQLNIPKGEKEFVLYFSFIGKKTYKVKYTGQEVINVMLLEDEKEMEEVVVTGYGNIKKSSFTGNATTVTKEQLLKTNNKNAIAALQTFDPSFRLKENNVWGSDPNSLPEFNIRGESSIEINKGLAAEENRRTQRTNLKDNPNLPIFILDGFQVDVQKIYDMDINRIESMTILKDAAATAMYGSQAANGVVVVTTVAPKPGEMRITYNFSGGATFPDLSDYNLCNGAEMLEVERLSGMYEAEEGPNDVGWRDREYQARLNNVIRGVETDWMALPLRNVFNHTHSLNLQGGEESIRYSLDLNYDSNEGVMKESRRSRMGAGLTLDYRPKKWLQIMNSVSYNQTKSENSPYGIFSKYTTLKPYVELYDDEGKMVEFVQVGTYKEKNPLYDVMHLNSFDGRTIDDDITDNFNVNMYFLDGFQFKGSFSIRKQTGKSETFVDPRNNDGGLTDQDRGKLLRSQTGAWSWNAKAMFYYNKTVGGNHFVNATLGMDVNEARNESNSATFTGFGLSNSYTPIYAAKQPQKLQVSDSRDRRIGFLGSVNYSFKDIYLFDGSFRFDASSKFGKDNQWAPFWSVGGGINIHNYDFLKDNWLISMLKVRASYGSTGNVSFPSSLATTTYKVETDSWFFTGPAAGLMALGNPQLTWEKTNTLDVGLNISFLHDLIYVGASYYCKKTEDLIDNISVRKSSGFNSYSINSGGIKNEGIEVSLNATLFRNKDWMITVNANLAHNRNTITKLGEDAKKYNEAILAEWGNLQSLYKESVLSSPVILYYEGASKSALYAVRSEGIDPANGKERFIKKNGMSTYTWDPNDQVVVGDNNPDAQGSFGLNMSWKRFYVNMSFMYQWGAQAYNETLLNKVENANIQQSNVDRRVLSERWFKPGDRAPFYDIGNDTQTQVTSRLVQDYNYLQFSGLSLGYDFSQQLISKWRLKTLGLRFNMNDICRWSTVKEERGTSYPYARNYSFTLSVGI